MPRKAWMSGIGECRRAVGAKGREPSSALANVASLRHKRSDPGVPFVTLTRKVGRLPNFEIRRMRRRTGLQHTIASAQARTLPTQDSAVDPTQSLFSVMAHVPVWNKLSHRSRSMTAESTSTNSGESAYFRRTAIDDEANMRQRSHVADRRCQRNINRANSLRCIGC